MADANVVRTSAGGNGTVTVRQRPAALLMIVRLKAAEATLELGLAKLTAACEATAKMLKRLGAVSVDFGEPHFDDPPSRHPMARLVAMPTRAIGNRSDEEPSEKKKRSGVNAVMTATWDIAALSAVETLILVDRLRFEAAEDTGVEDEAEEPTSWASQEEQMQAMMAKIAKMHEPPPDDGMPQFLFVARLSAEQLEKASAEAYAKARANAEQLARAAGMRLGALSSLNFGIDTMALRRHDKIMEQQRCVSLVGDSSYSPAEHEVISDDPRSAEISVNVNAHYTLEAI